MARDEETYAAAILACVSGKQWARGSDARDVLDTFKRF